MQIHSFFALHLLVSPCDHTIRIQLTVSELLRVAIVHLPTKALRQEGVCVEHLNRCKTFT